MIRPSVKALDGLTMSSTYELARWPELQSRFNLPWTFRHACRMDELGKFPHRIKIGHRTVMWRVADVEKWIAERATGVA